MTSVKEAALSKRRKQRLVSRLAALKSYNHENPAEEVEKYGASKNN